MLVCFYTDDCQRSCASRRACLGRKRGPSLESKSREKRERHVTCATWSATTQDYASRTKGMQVLILLQSFVTDLSVWCVPTIREKITYFWTSFHQRCVIYYLANNPQVWTNENHTFSSFITVSFQSRRVLLGFWTNIFHSVTTAMVLCYSVHWTCNETNQTVSGACHRKDAIFHEVSKKRNALFVYNGCPTSIALLENKPFLFFKKHLYWVLANAPGIVMEHLAYFAIERALFFQMKVASELRW